MYLPILTAAYKEDASGEESSGEEGNLNIAGFVLL
jgi:hypothetical protein